jgi:phage baseplate assembly protein W
VTTAADHGWMDAAPAQRTPADRWLGNGFRFPFRPVPQPGTAPGGAGEPPPHAGIRVVGGMALVRQSIQIILDTEPGERVMEPLFGCGLRRYLMAPNTAATRTAIRNDVTEALTLWEPRIRVTAVAVTPAEEPTLLYLDIAYQRLFDLRPDNLVYPFYLA